jgi:hypothetical protein
VDIVLEVQKRRYSTMAAESSAPINLMYRKVDVFPAYLPQRGRHT